MEQSAKVALCFIISGNHVLNKETLWREWIEPNKDIINTYFHYKDYSKISSNWIKNNAMPPREIQPSSYYHVVNAYMAILHHAKRADETNKWFCLLTESCVPIISPHLFRKKFLQNKNKSILNWKKPYWNIHFHHRANLKLLPNKYHLSHDPWFILTKKHVEFCLHFLTTNTTMYKKINAGGLANESIFAIILEAYNELTNSEFVENSVTTLTDWSRKTSPTSPWTFHTCEPIDVEIIEKMLKNNPNACFLRKVGCNFPDSILKSYSSDAVNK